MNNEHSFSSASPSFHAIASILEAYDPYIVSLSALTNLSYMDRDDLAQCIRIRMMYALHEKSIHHLPRYMKSVAHNEYVSFIRRRQKKLTVPLIDNDDDEDWGCREDELVATKEGFRDPQVEFEATNGYHELLEMIVHVILTLSRVQMHAAICSIRDHMDDPLSLAAAFMRHNLDISSYQWPTDPKEKQRMQASYAPVRKKLAQALGVDLALFKVRGPARAVCA
jgi:DNA-directed RNA polymerase specialized sigma24 family protein